MDLSANEAFLLCKRFHDKGWVQVGVGDWEEGGGGYADGGPAAGASGGGGTHLPSYLFLPFSVVVVIVVFPLNIVPVSTQEHLLLSVLAQLARAPSVVT